MFYHIISDYKFDHLVHTSEEPWQHLPSTHFVSPEHQISRGVHKILEIQALHQSKCLNEMKPAKASSFCVVAESMSIGTLKPCINLLPLHRVTSFSHEVPNFKTWEAIRKVQCRYQDWAGGQVITFQHIVFNNTSAS